MGTKVQNLPGYCSMRDLKEESTSCGWPLFYGDKTLTNWQYYNNYLHSTTMDACPAYDKDFVKQMMLDHEIIFKKQVFELHRLYRIQRGLMDEVRRKELHENQIPVETCFSTGNLVSQLTSEDGKKWHIPGFPIGSSASARPSISGVGGIHSPLGSINGINKQAGMFPSPNGSSSKEVEVLESRPSKVRRKMFDLHLPADEYIDPEESEKLSDGKIRGTVILLPDRNCKHGKGGDVKLISCNDGSHEGTTRLEQSLRNRNDFADLNEPVQVEETNSVAYVHLLNHNPCHRATECSDISAKQKLKLFGLSREELYLHCGTDSWAQNSGHLENNGTGKGWNSSVFEAGKAKSSLKSILQVQKQEQSPLSSQTMQDALSKGHEPTSDYLTAQRIADLGREKTDIGEKNQEYSINKHSESVVSSHRHGLFAVAPSSDLARSWSYSTSWEIENSSLNQKLMLRETLPCLNASGALSRNSQSRQSNGTFGDYWPLNINSKLNQAFLCEVTVQNGFYPGSSSGSKELSTNISSFSYDFLNHNNDSKRFPEHFNNCSEKHCNGSNSVCNGMKSGKDVDLNSLLSNGASNNLVTEPGLGILDREPKREGELAVLPWLRAKIMCKSEAQNTGTGLTARELGFLQVASLTNIDETEKGSSGKYMLNVTSGLFSNHIEPRKTDASKSSSNNKILGIPIFDMTHISPKKLPSFMSPSSSVPNPSDVEVLENNQKNCVLDINLPCDANVLDLDAEAIPENIVSGKGSPPTKASSRNQIDLNLSMSDDEAFVLTSRPITKVKMKAEIDLEAPAVSETVEDAISEEQQLETPAASPQGPHDTVEQLQDELMKCAAEAIVGMSSLLWNQVGDVINSSSESLMVDPLSWFVDVVSSCIDDLEIKFNTTREKGEDNEESSSEGLDYFESMTLKLKETKEDDYMPKPLVPENLKVEETGTTSLSTRAQKGPVRRGRQRRDFQRDLLPGLASLLRHEVTEDLQIFGGLMRATGHSWHSGSTRRSSYRNGCGRRRRAQAILSPPPPVATIEACVPLIQQLNNIEVGLEDRSLAGWGKTTRRPRRQRCPAGIPPSIPLI